MFQFYDRPFCHYQTTYSSQNRMSITAARSCSFRYAAYFRISAGVTVKCCFFVVVSSLASDTTILPNDWASMHRALWVNLPSSYKYSVGVVVQ